MQRRVDDEVARGWGWPEGAFGRTLVGAIVLTRAPHELAPTVVTIEAGTSRRSALATYDRAAAELGFDRRARRHSVRVWRSDEVELDVFDRLRIGKGGEPVEIRYLGRERPTADEVGELALPRPTGPVHGWDKAMVILAPGRRLLPFPDRVVEQLVPDLVIDEPPGYVVEASNVDRIMRDEVWWYGITKTVASDGGVEARILESPVDLDDRGFDSLVRHYGAVRGRWRDSPYHHPGCELVEFDSTTLLWSEDGLGPALTVDALLADGRQMTQDVAGCAEQWMARREHRALADSPESLPVAVVDPPPPMSQIATDDVVVAERIRFGHYHPGYIPFSGSAEFPTIGRYHVSADVAVPVGWGDIDPDGDFGDYDVYRFKWNRDTEMLSAQSEGLHTPILFLGRCDRTEVERLFPAEAATVRDPRQVGTVDDVVGELGRHLPFGPTASRAEHVAVEVADLDVAAVDIGLGDMLIGD